MSESTIHSAVIEVGVDGSGVDAGIAKIESSVNRLGQVTAAAGKVASAGINQIGAGSDAAAAKVESSTGKIGRSIATLGQQANESGKAAADSIGKIGDGGNAAAAKVDAATKNMIGSIQRTTATLEAGSKSSAKYYETLAGQRGIDVNSLKPYLDQLDAVKIKQELASKALLAADPAMKQIGMSAAATANAMRNVPAQFTDIITSLQGGQKPLTVLLQQGGQLKDMFGGIGPAAKALGGYVAGLVNPFTVAAAAAAGLAYAYSQGAEESRAYQKALILSGNAVGLTASQLSVMALNISAVSGTTGAAAEALTLMAGSGKIASENLEYFTSVATKMDKVLGTSVADTVKQFEELAKSPLAASLKLNEQINYLTTAVYQQIKALEEQGRVEEAGAVAQTAYANAMGDRTKKIQDNLGFLETSYKNITGTVKGFWDAILGVGRSDPGTQIKSLNDAILKVEARIKAAGAGSMALAGNIQQRDMMLKQLASLQAASVADGAAATSSKQIADDTKRNVARDSYMGNTQYADKKTKYALEVKKEEAAFAEAVQGFEKTSKEYEEAKKRHQSNLAQIAEQNKDKGGAAGVKKEENAYASLISTIKAKTEQNKLEVLTNLDATESQKFAIKMAEDLASGKLKLTAVHKKEIDTWLESWQASEKANKSHFDGIKIAKDLAAFSEQQAIAIRESSAALAVEYEMYGKGNDAREYALVAIKANVLAEKEIAKLKKDGLAPSQAQIDQLTAEAAARGKVEQATLGQSKALGYAAQLRDDNRKFATEYIFDEKERAKALLDIDAEVWQERIKLAGEGTEAQKKLQTEYAQWYANQLNKPAIDEWKNSVKAYDDIFRKGFADMVNGGKGTWKSFTTSLVTSFKTTVADQIYKMFLKPFVVNIIGNMLGLTGLGGGGASAGGGASGLIGSASNAYSMYSNAGAVGNAVFGSGSGTVASYLAGTSTVAPTSVLAANAAGAIGGDSIATLAAMEGWTTATTAATVAAEGATAATLAGTAAVEAGTVAATASGGTAAAGAAAIPVVGWIAAAGILAYMAFGQDDGPEQNTTLKFGSNNKAGNTSNNQRGPGDNPGAYIDGSSAGAFGTFGVVETLWMDARQQIVQDFIKNTTITDNALAKLLTDAEITRATEAVTNQSSTAYTGPEGSNPNGTGQLDLAFKDRMIAIFDGVESGLSSVITGFTGGAAQLASEAQALLTVRKNIDSYTELFGQDVSLQLLATSFAGLKVEGESTATVISRMAKTFSETSAVATMLGQDGSAAFGAIGLASSEARLKLVELSGGLEAFSAKAISYAQNYLTPEEQLAPKVTAVDKALADLGYTGIKTRDQFRALVEGLDLSSQAGATTYAALMNLSPAFAEITQATKSVADAAMKALESAVSKQRDIVTTAYNLTSQSIQTGIDNVSASLSKFQGLADALKSTLNEIRPMSRVEAQGYFGAQLDIAKAGGPVPTAADIGPALEALKKPSEDLFSTFLDWQRDQQMTANVIEEAAKLAGEQVSYEEQALKALQSQSDQLRRTYEDEMMRLDDILVSAQAQIDGLDTVNSSVLSVAEAIANLQDMLNPNSAKKKEAEASAMLGNGNDPTHTRGGIEEWSKSPTGMYYQSSGGAKYTASDNLIRAPGSAVGYTPDEVRKFIDDGLAGGDIASLAKTILSKGGSAESVDLLLSLPPGTSEEFLRGKIPGFAGGGDFGGGLRMVGENGPELEVTGPSRIFNASQTRQMMQGGDNAQLSEAVDRLTAIVAQQQAALESIERATTKTANTLVTVTRGGEAMQTEVAA